MEVDLRHLTAFMNQGLIRSSCREDAPHPISLTVRCRDSILITGNRASLVQHQGPYTIERLQEMFVWKGDRNAYGGGRVFWSIENQLDSQVQEMQLSAWRDHWSNHLTGDENLPVPAGLHLTMLPHERPLHSHFAREYVVETTRESNLQLVAGDGEVLGFQFEYLPTVLTEKVASEPVED